MLRLILLTAVFISVCPLPAQTTDSPLTALPYSPSLDLTSLDRAADPCADFYRFACGGWISNNPIPPDQARWSVYAKLSDENQRFLWGLLEEAAKPRAARSKIETEIGDYFSACLDQAAIEQAGAAPLRASLESLMRLKSLRELPTWLAEIQLNTPGDQMLFGFDASQDFADSTRVIAFLSAGGLGLPDRDYYVKTDAKSVETRERYLQHVTKMFQLLGEPPSEAGTHARLVMAIETALAQASLTAVERRDPQKLFHKTKIGQLQSLTPDFRWKTYFAGLKIANPPVVNVTQPRFFTELEKQLESRSLDDWKTYFRWHLAHAAAPRLSHDFEQTHFDFYKTYLQGVKVMPARWKTCVRGVDEDLGEALGQVFVAKTFDSSTKTRTVTMTREIEAAMQSEIEQLSWMSPATKRRALEKLHTIANKIGYPDRWRDYSAIEIRRDDYFGNVQRAAHFESLRQLAKIGKPVDRGEWGMTPPTVNAYYNPQMNDINFPAGVLQPPLYDPKMDDAPNYGNTGATIGHELTHGFDDEGRQFDAKGNLRDWRTVKDAGEFSTRAKCVSDQYSQFTIIDDLKINGQLTLGEDVADLGGTLLAYIAWKKATAGQDLKPIDGFTPDQRFFIGMAQWACSDERPESKRLHGLTNPHSPEVMRINGVVSNMPEFAKAFACREGQAMVRPQACKVW